VRVRHKLLAIVASATAAALLLAGAALYAWDLVRLRRELLGDLAATAALVAEHSTAALSFDDPTVAEQNLRSLRSQAHVVAGCLYDMDGELFARYRRSDAEPDLCPEEPRTVGAAFSHGVAELWTAVSLDGARIGTLYLRSSLGTLRARQRVQLWTLAGALAVALAGGLLLALRLQRIVEEPVSELAAVASAVTLANDYSLRAERRTEDEIGELVDSFNRMLAQVETADASLRQAKDERARTQADDPVVLHVTDPQPPSRQVAQRRLERRPCAAARRPQPPSATASPAPRQPANLLHCTRRLPA